MARTNNDVITELTPEQVARFWSKVEKTDEHWLWRGAIHPNGYGTWSVNRPFGSPSRYGSIRPHRLAWWLLRGAIPDGHVIDHRCRLKACVNPDHLQSVSPETNSARVAHDALSMLNAEAELERIVSGAPSARAAASAVLSAVLDYPQRLGLMHVALTDKGVA